MLDQNTDRMWFVIGAVIVGAAIIFIANGTLPTLFASVTDTFQGSADQASSVIDTLSPLGVPYDLINSDFTEGDLGWVVRFGDAEFNGNTAKFSGGVDIYQRIDSADIGDRIRIQVRARGSGILDVRYGRSHNPELEDNSFDMERVNLTSEFQTYTVFVTYKQTNNNNILLVSRANSEVEVDSIEMWNMSK